MHNHNHPIPISIKHRRHAQTGFTLIELMIVVVIISILGALVVPLVFKVLTKARTSYKISAKKPLHQKALQVRRIRRTNRGFRISKRLLPSVVDSSHVHVKLQVRFLLEQGRVIPAYDARFQGKYILKNPTNQAFYASLFFPFPKGAGTFSHLSFQQSSLHPSKTATSQPSVTQNKSSKHVRMTPYGMTWNYRFLPNEQLKVSIKYHVRGREQYRYRIASGKKQKFHFTMDVVGADPLLPSTSLQPTSHLKRLTKQQLVHHFSWKFDHFLSTQPIEVRFPKQYAKYYRFSLLGKLGFIALLFFGLFFWLLSEQFHPTKVQSGGKSLVNFAFLLAGFVSFFPLFIYLEDHVTIWQAFSIAISSASLLTTFHVAMFMGIRWGLLVNLPLQLFFTAGFTFAVLVPTYRPLAFTVGAVILVAFLIVSHARHQKQKAKEEEDARKEHERKRLEKERKRKQETLAITSKEAMAPDSFATDSRILSSNIQPTADQQSESSCSHQDDTDNQFCLFCRATVEPHFKHCHECGERLQRTHSCTTCHEEYWFPSVNSFTYCRKCGDTLYPPPSPLPSIVPD